VITNFAEICPSINISTTFLSAADFTQQLTGTLEVTTEPLTATLEAGNQLTATLEITEQLAAPDLFIASHIDLEAYQAQDLIQDIAQAVDKTSLTSYLPKAIGGLSAGDSLYGLPQALHLPALYYHPDLVESPAGTFTSLLE
jgi:maltose-binding protein MalE